MPDMAFGNAGDDGVIGFHQRAEIGDFTRVVHAQLKDTKLAPGWHAGQAQGRADMVVQVTL